MPSFSSAISVAIMSHNDVRRGFGLFSLLCCGQRCCHCQFFMFDCFNATSCWRPLGMAARPILSRCWPRAPISNAKIGCAVCIWFRCALCLFERVMLQRPIFLVPKGMIFPSLHFVLPLFLSLVTQCFKYVFLFYSGFLKCSILRWPCVFGGESDSQFGRTALILAAARGHADCVQLLIDAGADKEAKDRVRCRPLFCCRLCFGFRFFTLRVISTF
jgi:hypothetical protein